MEKSKQPSKEAVRHWLQSRQEERRPLPDPQQIRRRFQKLIQAVVDAGACPMQPTTVVDLTGDAPVLVRVGRGDPARLGLALPA